MINLNRNILLGTVITLAGSFLYVLMGFLSKEVGKHTLIHYIIFLQSLTGLFCACYLLRIKKYHWKKIFSQQKFDYLLRTLMSVSSIYALFYGLQYLSIFNALVILNTSALIIPFLRRIFFQKKIDFFIFPAVLIAFIGILFILSPDHQIATSAIFIVVISMLCMSFSLLMIEKAQYVDPSLSIFYYFFYSSLIITLLLIVQHQFIRIPIAYLPITILIGILFFFVQLSMVYAAKYISSQLISTLFYSEIIISLFFSILFENVTLTNYLMIGTTLVITGVLAVAFIENKSHILSLKGSV